MPVRAEDSRASEPTLSGLGSVRHGLSFWKGEFAEETGKWPDLGVGHTDTSGPGALHASALVCTPLCSLLWPSPAVNGLSLPSPRKSAARGSSQAGLCPGSGQLHTVPSSPEGWAGRGARVPRHFSSELQDGGFVAEMGRQSGLCEKP